MYAALWRVLPGNRWAKSGQSLVLFLAVVAVLFLWVFPLVTPYLPFENVTVQPSSSPATPSPSSSPSSPVTPSPATPSPATTSGATP